MKFKLSGSIPFQLDKILNNGIELGDNVNGALVEFTSTGEAQTVQHGLGRVPIGFILLLTDKDTSVWATQLQSWTKESLVLNTSVENATVRLFVL